MSHANISIFVTHLGCPNQCSFCNQRHIAKTEAITDTSSIDKAVLLAKTSKNYDPKNTQIAFFGGSFTAIDREYMLSLLKTAYNYIKSGDISGIRISTRPDFIDEEVLEILKEYGVIAIELGAQSMCDDVLLLNDRGHTAEDVKKASKLIKSNGFELGLQMMTGLFGDSDEKAIKTAQKIIELKPSTVRIYPTIVLKGTRLEQLLNTGEYKPQTLDEAIRLSIGLKNMFLENDIKVIRLGLHTIDESMFVAGPWHPSFAELCESEEYFKRFKDLLKEKGSYELFVYPSELSKAIGNKRKNINRMAELGVNLKISPSESLEKHEIKVVKN